MFFACKSVLNLVQANHSNVPEHHPYFAKPLYLYKSVVIEIQNEESKLT
jgi:hypothetical protein